MMVEPISITKREPVSAAQTGLPAAKGPPQDQNGVQNEQKAPDLSQLSEVVAAVQKNLHITRNVNLQFSVHKDSGRVVVTVTDEDTGKVIREIPPKEVLNLASQFAEMVGMVFDKKG